MATGDQTDFVTRLKTALPGRWFPLTGFNSAGSATPVLDGILAGIASSWAWLYSLIVYAKLQTRLTTATDVWLDIAANDYLGPAFLRKSAEPDAAFSLRIRANLLPPLNTRAAMVSALTQLTGRTPAIFEPWNPGDAGGYGSLTGGQLGDVPIVAADMQTGWTLGGQVAGPSAQMPARYVTGTGIAGSTNALVIPLSGVVASVLLYVFIPKSSSVGVIPSTPGYTGSGTYTQNQWVQFAIPIPPANQVNPVITIQANSPFSTGQFLITDIFIPVAGAASYAGMAYGIAGGWGSLRLPTQAFITAYRQTAGGIAKVAGYNGQLSAPEYAPGGYGVGAIEYTSPAMAGTQVEDADIFATVARVQAAGVECWTRIQN